MAKPDSYRLRVLKALTAQLLKITPANGYDFDMTGKVHRGRILFGSESLDAVPFLSILEAPKPAFGIAAAEQKVKRSEAWLLFVQGWAQDDKANPTDPAYALMAAVEECLGEVTSEVNGQAQVPASYLLGGLIGSMTYGPGLCHPPQADLSSKAFFYLPVEVGLVYDVRKPYTAPNET